MKRQVNITDQDKLEAKNLELRSDQLTEILGQVPKWIIRNGTIIILLVFLSLLIGASLLRYPDVLQARIILTTETPPAEVTAKTSAQIRTILVKDKEKVYTDQILVVLESAASYDHVLLLSGKLGSKLILDSLLNANFPDELDLGIMQEPYASLLKKLQEYSGFIKLDYHQRKISSVKTELKKYYLYLEKLKDQERVLYLDYTLTGKQYKRDSLLFMEGVISSVQLEKSEAQKLSKLYEWKETQTQLASGLIKISDLQQEVLELELNQEENSRQYIQSVQEAYEKLKGQISMWNQEFLIQSPFDGHVSFTKIWAENQYVETGDIVLTVLPVNQGAVLGKIFLPATGVGKVKEGFKVIIRFDNYPFMEFGTISGKISSISTVPTNEIYALEVKLDNAQLITSYNIPLNFQQNMPGMAEIITNQRTLLNRILDPFRSAYRTQIHIRK
jgi:multidrug resistance efflux pump